MNKILISFLIILSCTQVKDKSVSAQKEKEMVDVSCRFYPDDLEITLKNTTNASISLFEICPPGVFSGKLNYTTVSNEKLCFRSQKALNFMRTSFSIPRERLLGPSKSITYKIKRSDIIEVNAGLNLSDYSISEDRMVVDISELVNTK